MNIWKKVLLSVLSVVLILVVGVCAYGVKIASDANITIQGVFESIDRTSTKRTAVANIDAQEPFSILLMGIDNGDFGRESDVGRSDTTMVVTINPKEKKSTMISLDRDIYTELVGNDTWDKLNHAFAYGGSKMAMDSVEELLDIPLDHYVSINMKGLKDLIDAVGGIEVNNPFEFTLDGVTVPAGDNVKLDGVTGVAYARMRKEDPEGDIGRQKRQREVVQKILDKIISIDGITKYKKILNAVSDNVKTDLTWDDMIDIQGKYLPAFKTVDSLQLQGEDMYLNDIYYQALDPVNLFEVQTKLRAQLGLPKNDEMEAIDQSKYGNFGTTDVYSQDTAQATYGVDQGTYTDNGQYVDPNQQTQYVDPNVATDYGNGEGGY